MSNNDIIKAHYIQIGKDGAKKLKDSMTPEEYKAEMKRRSQAALAKRWGNKDNKK